MYVCYVICTDLSIVYDKEDTYVMILEKNILNWNNNK